jgi:hypothetical protein
MTSSVHNLFKKRREVVEMEIEEMAKRMFAMWRGVLDRLYEEQKISGELADILEEEFEFVLRLAFDIDMDAIASEVKRIIYP